MTFSHRSKDWNKYRSDLMSEKIPDAAQATLVAGTGAHHFAGGKSAPGKRGAATITLIELLQARPGADLKTDDIMKEKDRYLFDLGMEFLECARSGSVVRLAEIAAAGFNPNFLDPRNGRGALHAIALSGSRRLLRAFLKAENIDFLVADPQGRLPSDLARYGNRDRVIARYLRLREGVQLRAGETAPAQTPE